MQKSTFFGFEKSIRLKNIPEANSYVKKLEKNIGEKISALALFSFMLYDFENREFYSSYSITLYNTSQYPFTLERKYINLNISDKTGSRL